MILLKRKNLEQLHEEDDAIEAGTEEQHVRDVVVGVHQIDERGTDLGIKSKICPIFKARRFSFMTFSLDKILNISSYNPEVFQLFDKSGPDLSLKGL